MYSDPEVVRFMSNGVLDEAQLHAQLKRSLEAARARPRTVYEYAITVGGDVVGRAGFSIQRPEHQEAMIFFTARRDCWGKGYVTAGMKQVLRVAFEEAGL